MITPRRTRLWRSPDLASFRARLIACAQGLDPLRAADTFILVPTRAAGEQLRRTIEDRLLVTSASACVLPLIGTRADLYDTFATRLHDLPRVPTGFEREVMLGAAARDTEDAGLPPPFHLRPALVAELLALYDQVRRLGRTVDDFERLVTAELAAAAEIDRGASQLLEQTRFVVAAFRGYESRLAEGELKDEHLVREAVLTTAAARPLHHVVITVGDRLSDPEGLWPADVVLLTAVSGLDAIDVVATNAVLDAGYLDRLRLAFVDIEETAGDTRARPPVLITAKSANVFEYRDREDELEGVARRLKASRRDAQSTPLDRHALVVARPLPYLYLARDVFGGAGIPFETLDTLPLAAEPYSAALDLVIEFVASEFTRGALTALLRSPHFRFSLGDHEVTPAEVLKADIALAEGRYLGGFDRLARLAGADDALPAIRAAYAAASLLTPLADTQPLAEQIERLVAFLLAYDRPPAADVPERDRRQRVQAAVIGALSSLSEAYRRHDPAASGTVADLGPAVRRWLGAQTFAARTGEAGLQIVDVQAARFGDFDDVQLMGLVDGEWPERPRRNIFYPQSLLAQLEPARPEQVELHREREMLRAGRAAFRDLVGLANLRTCVSTFSLESDAVVEPSVLIDDLDSLAAGMRGALGDESGREMPPVARPVAADDSESAPRVFAWEALALAPPLPDVLDAPAAAWARARIAAAQREVRRSRGEAGPWQMPRVSVSRLETYLKCPFQFYAKNVLLLEEEPEDELTRSPLERGRFLHELFETFFHEWQMRGHRRITPDSIDEARALFTEVCEPALVSLGPAEAGLERAHLFGSAVAPGIADRVFAMEAERPVDIRRRLMEYELDGAFSFSAQDGTTRTVRLRAKIDRVDLLDDGSFRLIDYKTSYVMDRRLALQLPIYSACVRERLSKEAGRPVPVSEAMYLSFEGQKSVVALEARGKDTDELIVEAEHRLTGALDDIAAGHYPPRPHQKSLCKMCAYVSVCRHPGGISEVAGTEAVEPGDE